MPTAEILSQGDEVVTGQVADTNAAWLATRLTEVGITVRGHSSVGDRKADIVALLRAASERADILLCTGGLGPTEDDLTAAAVAEAFDRPLVFDPVAMEQIEALYARFHLTMPEINRKQAWLPRGARRIDNPWGTAPGFSLKEGRSWFAFLPGVPREMRKLYDATVLPRLHEHFQLQPWRLVTLRTVGVGESTLQERLQGLDVSPAVVSFRTKLPENHIKLRIPPTVTDAQLLGWLEDAAQRIGASLFTVEGAPAPLSGGIDQGGGTLAEVVARALAHRGETLAVAESCSGGRLAAACTALPGASAWFLEGAVTYANAAKVRLGVPAEDLATHGAVSEPVAKAMAAAVRERAGSSYGLATTGIAGPTGGSEAKPVGTVHLALATPTSTEHRRFVLPGGRNRMQELTVGAALDMLRRHIHRPRSIGD
jgi:nicotinamide-nucleotide amidase